MKTLKFSFIFTVLSAELTQSLADFVSKETSRLHDKNAMEVINKVKTGEVNVDQLVEKWTKTFSEVIYQNCL